MKSFSSKKDRHINFALSECAKCTADAGFDDYRFEHNALPEIDFSEIDTSTEFLERKLNLPLVISSITGGSGKSEKINRLLAEIANDFGIGFAVGSQACALRDPSLENSFKIRKYAPNALILSNLGAADLNYGFSLDECKKAVEMIEADGLFLHLNPLHEVFQANGTTNFSGLLKKIENICSKLGASVIVKEVGYGISSAVAQKLINAGVFAIEVAGAGSISWSGIEQEASENIVTKTTAKIFQDWGNPTAECVKAIAQDVKNAKIIASGGVDDGLKMAKAMALGADLCGNAGAFLQHIVISQTDCENFVKSLAFELKTAMFCTGCKDINELKAAKLVRK